MIEAATPKEQTLHALYRDHRSWLENWLRQRMGNAWDAADLSQDTFVRVLASAQPLADLREPRAYLLTVGKRLLSNFYTRRSLEQAYLDALAQLPEDSVPSPSNVGCCSRPCRPWTSCLMGYRQWCAGRSSGASSKGWGTGRLPNA